MPNRAKIRTTRIRFSNASPSRTSIQCTMSVRALHSLNPFFLLSPNTAKAPNSSAIPVCVPCQPRRLKPLKCLSQQHQLPQSKSQVQVQEKLPTQADAESPEQEDEKKEEKEEVVEKAIVYGANGIAFKLPGAPFEYQYSYTETPKTKPLKVRERFLPFGPDSMNRPWTGKRPQKPSKKKRPELDSFKPPPPGKKGVKPVQAPGPFPPGQRPKIARTREDILGEPLTEEERLDLIKSSIRERRTLQIGRDGLTHNMLDNIHAHWKRRRVCRLKCLGVSTVDMDNICEKLEEKAGGKVIHRQGGVILLFRGRNYNYKTRPVFPLMLWKPKSPVYPKLIQDAPGGLTIEEAAALRKKGHLVPPICTLAKNGVYIELVRDVRHAFEVCELVRINCQKLSASDFKKIGAKLRDLVPCVLLSFEYQHILMWRGKDWKPMETEIKKVSTQTEEYIDADQEPCTSDVSRESNTQSDVKLEGQGLESVSAPALEKTNGNSFDVRRDTTAEPGETTINLDNFSQERNRLHQDRFAFSSEEKQEAEKREPNIEKDFLLPPKLHSISDESKIEGQPTILSNAFQNSVSNMNTDEGESINLVTSNDCSSQAASSQHTLTETSTCGNDNRETLAEPSKEVINEMPNDILDGQIVDGQMASPNSESDPERKVRLNLDDLWVKAIESGRLLLLEESDPDPDYVLSKAIAFANNAPPCPAFERKVKAGKDGNRKQKIRRQQKWLQDNENNEATNESSGALRVDELAKLLAS